MPMTVYPTAEDRRNATERRLYYCQQFAESARKHIPALLAGERDSQEWRAAAEWWERCNVKVVLSEDPARG